MAEEHQHSEGTERVREAIRDGFTIMLGAASWAFEMGDSMIDTWLRQGQISREEGRRRFDEFATSTRRRGEDLGRRVSESMRSSMPVATRDQVASFEGQGAKIKQQITTEKNARPPSSLRATTT